MPVRYSEHSSGPETRRRDPEPEIGNHGPYYYDEIPADISATEAAIELADELGIDLSLIEGTGLHGRITKGDVEAALQG